MLLPFQQQMRQGIMSKYTNATDDIPAKRTSRCRLMEKFLQGADRTYAKFVDRCFNRFTKSISFRTNKK